MFRDTESGETGVKPGQEKDAQGKMDQKLANPAAARRAEGGSANEPSFDFDRQDQAVQYAARPRVKTDPSRDALLTAFGKATLTDRYLMPGETFQDLFARVASY